MRWPSLTYLIKSGLTWELHTYNSYIPSLLALAGTGWYSGIRPSPRPHAHLAAAPELCRQRKIAKMFGLAREDVRAELEREIGGRLRQKKTKLALKKTTPLAGSVVS